MIAIQPLCMLKDTYLQGLDKLQARGQCLEYPYTLARTDFGKYVSMLRGFGTDYVQCCRHLWLIRGAEFIGYAVMHAQKYVDFGNVQIEMLPDVQVDRTEVLEAVLYALEGLPWLADPLLIRCDKSAYDLRDVIAKHGGHLLYIVDSAQWWEMKVEYALKKPSLP